MAGWFPGGQEDHRLYREAAQQHAPNVPVHFLDGGNPEIVRSCWAAADIFLSLVDNPQETFGLAPVEAMAAGLPVVVSDWDGYRFTVENGVEGFRIPTLATPAAQSGRELALRHDLGLVAYQDYVGATAQHTAVDVEAAARALARLAIDPLLRRRMGEEGRQTVIRRFSWRVIATQYRQLFEQQAELRGQINTMSLATAGPNPFTDDPFATFATFASTSLRPWTCISLAENINQSLQRLSNSPKIDHCYDTLRLDIQLTSKLLWQLQQQPGLNVQQIQKAWPLELREKALFSLVWLAKLGYITWQQPKDRS